MSESTNRIPQHKHCLYCGRAYVSGEGRYCSDLCRSEKTGELRKSKRKLLVIWAIAVVIMIGAIIYEMTA